MGWRFPLRTVRGRMLLAAICVEAVMLTLMVGNGLRLLNASLTHQAQVYSDQLSPVLHAAMVTPLAQRDYATLQAIVDESLRANVLSYLAVSDSRGAVVAISGLRAGASLPEPDQNFSLTAKDGQSRYDVRSSITIGSQTLGHLQFGLDLGGIVAARNSQLTQGVAIAIGGIMLSAAVLAAIGIWLTRHLSRLTKLSKEVAQGNYAPGLAPEGDDDIGRLGTAFNAMSRAVGEHVAELTVAIQKRRAVEDELRHSEARFRDLAGSASDWFWESDADYRLTFASPRIAEVLGVKPSSIVGMTWFEFGLDDFPEIAERHRLDIASRESFRDLVFTVGPPDGKDFRTIRISGIPSFGEDGRFEGYRGVGVNISREAEAERMARRARQQLVDAIESLADAIAVFDEDDRLVICNTAYAQMGRLEPAFLARPGITFEEILREAHRQNAFVITGMDFDTWLADRVARHRAADGRDFIVQASGGRWFRNREYPTHEGGVVAARVDITRLKQHEEALEKLRRRYELILSSAGDGIVGLDPHCGVVFANRMAATLLGINAERLVGVDLGEWVLDEGGRAPLTAACQRGISAQGRWLRFRHGDSGVLPIDYFIAPIIEDEAVGGAVLVFRDATLPLQYEEAVSNQHRELERQVAERTTELRASQEMLKRITDNLVEGVIVVDEAGDLAFANPSAARILEVADGVAAIEGCPIDTLLRLRTAASDVLFRSSPWSKAMAEGNIIEDDDGVFVLPSGRTVPVAYACAGLPGNGDSGRALISFRDIGALKRAQHEAMQSARLVSVGQLAAGIAHEINTPVQYIGDNLRYIDRGVDTLLRVANAGRRLAEEAAEAPILGDSIRRFELAVTTAKLPRLTEELPMAIHESLDGVTQIARIVLSMKEFSHPGTSDKVATDMNRAIENTLTVTRNVWKHVATVERRFDPELPPVPCHAGEINQVILNLVVNAAQAIESSGKPLPGTITISTRCDGDWVEIEVGDSGTGIPDAIRERIFDPFFTTKEVGKGTGQGLAICRDVVVTKHGGTLEIGGAKGEGAVFTVRLPIDGGDTKDEI